MNMKKLTALFSAFTVALSAVATGAAAVSAEGDTTESTAKTVQFAETQTVFESGYDSAKILNNLYTKDFSSYSNDWHPVEVNENIVMQLSKSGADSSYLYLGAKYENNTGNSVANESITVKSGESYKISFKYKITNGTNKIGNNFALGVCTTVPSTYTVAHDKTTDENGNTVNNPGNKSDWNQYENQRNLNNPSVVLSGAQEDTSEWVSAEVVYNVGTIGQTAETASVPNVAFDKLVIYAINYGYNYIYIDDVKVTKNTLYSGEQIYFNDFSDSKDCQEGGVWSGLQSSSGNAITLKDPNNSDNMLLTHIQGVWGHGALLIGAEMKNNTANINSAVKVKQGDIYKIDFDYKFSGNVTQSSVGYNVGVAVGSSTDHAVNNFDKYSVKQQIMHFDMGYEFDGLWHSYSGYFEVPEDAEFTNGDYLMLYFDNGTGNAKYYYDNVSVCKVVATGAIEKDGVISETDFSDSTVKTGRGYVDQWGDAYPVTDPLNSSGKAVLYNGGWYNSGAIYAGSSKTIANSAETEAIIAKPGAAYKVTFKYYATSKVDVSFKIGVRVKKTTGNYRYQNAENSWVETDYSNSYEKVLVEFEKGTEFNMSEYKTVEAIVKIPYDTDMSEKGDKLALFMYGQGFNLYINYLKFEELAPSTVKFETGNGFESAVFYTGDTASYSAAEGKTMLWYSDKDKSKSVRLADLDVGGSIKTETVYGTAVENGAPLIIGDTDMDGEFDADDIAQMRKLLIDETEMKSEYRTDVNRDGAVDIRDLVRIKKISASEVKALSEFKLVNETREYASILTNYEKLEKLVTGGETAEKTVTVKFDEKLGENEYLVRLDNSGNIVVAGGSETAVNAAILSFIGHINTGIEITNDYFICAEISGGATPAAVSYYFSEDFDTDNTKGYAIQNNAAYTENFSNGYFSPEGASYEIGNLTTAVSDGCLVLTGEAITDENGNTKYYGADVNTKKDFGYGYFEIKAKVNSSKGICPAFWLRTRSENKVGNIGYEIDIFECFGSTPEYIKGTLLAQNYNKPSEDKTYYTAHGFACEQLVDSLPEDYPTNYGTTYSYNKGGWGEEWHTFGLDYRKNGITWYIDGIAVLHADTPTKDTLGSDYYFNSKVYITLSCYAGREVAGLTGTPDETTDWENGNSLVVDWLRVIQY